MPGEVCPIFERMDDETVTLIGAWMLHPVNQEISPDFAMYPELGHVRPILEGFFTNEKFRKIPNVSVSLGRGCGFEGGSFLMGKDYPAPNEPTGKEYHYYMKENGGVVICVREIESVPADNGHPDDESKQFKKINSTASEEQSAPQGSSSPENPPNKTKVEEIAKLTEDKRNDSEVESANQKRTKSLPMLGWSTAAAIFCGLSAFSLSVMVGYQIDVVKTIGLVAGGVLVFGTIALFTGPLVLPVAWLGYLGFQYFNGNVIGNLLTNSFVVIAVTTAGIVGAGWIRSFNFGSRKSHQMPMYASVVLYALVVVLVTAEGKSNPLSVRLDFSKSKTTTKSIPTSKRLTQKEYPKAIEIDLKVGDKVRVKKRKATGTITKIISDTNSFMVTMDDGNFYFIDAADLSVVESVESWQVNVKPESKNKEVDKAQKNEDNQTKGFQYAGIREIEIRAVQETLKAKGYDPGTIDGLMGEKTAQALRIFQAVNNLHPSGKLDSKTAEALGFELTTASATEGTQSRAVSKNNIYDYEPISSREFDIALEMSGGLESVDGKANGGPIKKLSFWGQKIELKDHMIKDGFINTKEYGMIKMSFNYDFTMQIELTSKQKKNLLRLKPTE